MILEHKHLIIRCLADNPPKPEEKEYVRDWVKEVISRLKMKIMSGPHVEYCDVPGNKGFTTVTIIETSHVAMHIWDEVSPALIQFDVYSCGPLDPQIVFDLFDAFDPVKIEYKFLDREHGLVEIDTGITQKVA